VEQFIEQHKTATDVSLGSGAISSPMWWQYLEPTLQAILLIGGVFLLALRLHITFKEWRKTD